MSARFFFVSNRLSFAARPGLVGVRFFGRFVAFVFPRVLSYNSSFQGCGDFPDLMGRPV